MLFHYHLEDEAVRRRYRQGHGQFGCHFFFTTIREEEKGREDAEEQVEGEAKNRQREKNVDSA